jgi:hypothetical protein
MIFYYLLQSRRYNHYDGSYRYRCDGVYRHNQTRFIGSVDTVEQIINNWNIADSPDHYYTLVPASCFKKMFGKLNDSIGKILWPENIDPPMVPERF